MHSSQSDLKHASQFNSLHVHVLLTRVEYSEHSEQTSREEHTMQLLISQEYPHIATDRVTLEPVKELAVIATSIEELAIILPEIVRDKGSKKTYSDT